MQVVTICAFLVTVTLTSGTPELFSRPSVDDMTLDELMIRSYSSGRSADFIQSNNTLLVELDILLTPEQWLTRTQQGSSSREKRAGLKGINWPNGVIPYERISSRSHFSEEHEANVLKAFAEYERYTCLKFRPVTGSDRGFIYFFDGGGCFSPLGYQGNQQGVSLANGCRTVGVIIHELGHAIGIHHEQTRPDRDDYLMVYKSNIRPDMWYNFQKLNAHETEPHGIPYDYLSIMQYGETAFASDTSKPSMTPIDKRFAHRIGQSRGLSFEDIHLINRMYSCTDKCGGKTCPAGAMLSKDCQCWCKRNVEFGEPVAMCETGDRVPGGDADGQIGNCRDMRPSRDCAYWKNEGMCDDENKWVEFMTQSCRETCGKCDKEDEVEETVGKKKYCENSNGDWCRTAAKDGYCNTYADYMKSHCQRACGLCQEGVVTGLVCERSTLDLACKADHVIKVHDAVFGRLDDKLCNDGQVLDVQCRATDSVTVVKAQCEGKSDCTIQASTDVFQDACGSTIKYLSVDYSCEKAETGGGVKPVIEDCDDENPSCSIWAQHNYCHQDSEYHPYMSRACKKSCNLCDTGSNNCFDNSPNCKTYKENGECERYPNFMNAYCKRTCNTCNKSFRFTNENCRDANEDCGAWVERGMCEQNWAYMRDNCAKSCHLCE